MGEDLRARFELELRLARLDPLRTERERLYVMWLEHLPQREALRAAVPAPDEEPTFIEKPAAGPEPAGGRA